MGQVHLTHPPTDGGGCYCLLPTQRLLPAATGYCPKPCHAASAGVHVDGKWLQEISSTEVQQRMKKTWKSVFYKSEVHGSAIWLETPVRLRSDGPLGGVDQSLGSPPSPHSLFSPFFSRIFFLLAELCARHIATALAGLGRTLKSSQLHTSDMPESGDFESYFSSWCGAGGLTPSASSLMNNNVHIVFSSANEHSGLCKLYILFDYLCYCFYT